MTQAKEFSLAELMAVATSEAWRGNGEVLAWRAPFFEDLISDGTGLVALSYRGYGGSSGQPTEQNLLDDGMSAYGFTLGAGAQWWWR